MAENIRVVYVPVTGVPVRAYHMAIVYDKGDGITPVKVIQARPSIEYWSFNTSAIQTITLQDHASVLR